VTLISNQNVVAIAVEEVSNSTPSGPAPPPTLEALRLSAGEAMEVIDQAKGKPSEGLPPPPGFQKSISKIVDTISTSVQEILSPRAAADAAAAETETAAAQASREAETREAEARAKAQRDAEQDAIRAKAAAESKVTGVSQVSAWLDKKGLGACKKGLADVSTLIELANLEPTELRAKLASVDAKERTKLMKAIDTLEL